MRITQLDYLTKTILDQINVIDCRIDLFPDSRKKEIAWIKADELRSVIKAIRNEAGIHDAK